MTESFIPEGTCIICTNMTNGKPLEIQRAENIDKYNLHKAKDKPLLIVTDRKISDTFACVVPAINWGGLQALCLGIAVAALVVATVATGGLADDAVGFGWSFRGAVTYAGGRVTGNIAAQLEGAVIMAAKKGAFINIGAFLVNAAIAVGSDLYEQDQENKAIFASRNANRNDANNKGSVIALTQ